MRAADPHGNQSAYGGSAPYGGSLLAAWQDTKRMPACRGQLEDVWGTVRLGKTGGSARPRPIPAHEVGIVGETTWLPGRLPTQFGHERYQGIQAALDARHRSSTPGWVGALTDAVTMFADLRKSTSLIGILGPVHFRWFIGRLFSLIRAAVLDEHGAVEKFLGDGALAVFTKPGDVPGDDFPAGDPPGVRAARGAFSVARGFEELIG